MSQQTINPAIEQDAVHACALSGQLPSGAIDKPGVVQNRLKAEKVHSEPFFDPE